MNLDIKDFKIIVRPILDTVEKIIPAKIYDTKSPRYNQEYWIIKGKKNSFRVYHDIIEDKQLLETISNGFMLNKKYRFLIKKGVRGNQIVKFEEV